MILLFQVKLLRSLPSQEGSGLKPAIQAASILIFQSSLARGKWIEA